jgi:amidase
MTDVLSLDAIGQLRALAEKKISARELLEASVARADALHGRLNAVVSRDLDRAYEDALRVDDSRARGETLGPLAGLAMTVKDHLDVEGLPASFGGIETLLEREVKDAGVVRKVRKAGAIVWGKTNQSLYGGDWQSYNALYGTTNNPWDITRTPGGSSGGSAAAVASGMTALEIGSDIGGSLRHPASFCGIFTHKPTYGLVSQDGFVPPHEGFVPGYSKIVADTDLAVIGPMARSARDLEFLLSVMTDERIAAKASAVKCTGLRVAVWLDEPGFGLDPEVKVALEAFVERLSTTGAIIETVRGPVASEEMMFAYTTLLYAVMGYVLPWPMRACYESLRGPARVALAFGAKPLSWAQGVIGLTARHREWLIANEARAQMGEVVSEFFRRFDVLITPVSPVPAFSHDHGPLPLRRLECSDGRSIPYLEMLNWVALATLLGLPATVIPAGLTKGGLPIGVQIVGPRGGDSLTLSVAQGIEEEIEGFCPPPLA